METNWKRTNYASGAPWEDNAGYSRVVRVGPLVYATGTVAQRGGQVIAPGDMHGQTRACFEIILEHLDRAGAKATDVVRTRMFVTDIARFEEAARAHAEVFGDIRPCTTLVEVSGLVTPDYLVEVEADAVVTG